MGDVIEFPRPITTDSYNGGCPHCGGCDRVLNIGRDHWALCKRHQTKWYHGSNLYSNWRHENESIWLENEYRLGGYMTVEPIWPEPSNLPDI